VDDQHRDASTVLAVASALPGLVSTVFVLVLAGELVLPGAWGWILPGVWIAAGAVLFVRPVELGLVQLVFGFRRPTPVEARRLGPAWEAVCRSAGVDPAGYVLRVQESTHLNAFAAGGRVVAVTTAALELRPERLAAVLAHELGHHLAAHTTVSMLAWWFALPARGVAWLVRQVLRLVVSIARAGDLVGVLGAVLLALALLTGLAYLSLWLILMPFVSPLLAWAARFGEYRADRIAARLGYGAELAGVLQTWISLEGARVSGLWQRVLATHPPHASRIARLAR
jgi:Zn-dependent protease with chaperone function